MRLVIMATIILVFTLCAYSVTYDDDTSLHYYWSGATGSVDHYDVYVSIDGGASAKVGSVAVSPTADNPYLLPIVAIHGSTYVVTVQAVDITGNTGPMSEPSSPVECNLGSAGNAGLSPIPYGG